MSTFTNPTSRVAIDARIAERRRGNDDDYYPPTAKAKARAELVKWLWQV
jgi:hypothetical protein